MKIRSLRTGQVLMGALAIVVLVGGAWGKGSDFDSRFKALVKPHRLSIAGWQLDAFGGGIKQTILPRQPEVKDDVEAVTGYFAHIGRIKELESEIVAAGGAGVASLKEELAGLHARSAALAGVAERALERQIRQVLSEQGIYGPPGRFLKLRLGFPPVNFRLEEPPRLLVVSPLDRIERMREAVLRRDISLEEIEAIESGIDAMGVSSLVVDLGGFAGTYPVLVTGRADLRFTIDTAVEEWLHQYLAFRPLGFRYLLSITGISRDRDIATMNETLAGMVSREIGALVYEKYYGGPAPERRETEFDREMRLTRQAVDEFLARGELDAAAAFMEERREYLVSKGYRVRKLNQAYFAFYGAYADRPGTADPIAVQFKQLREQSASLKEFLDRAAAMTSPGDLAEALQKTVALP